MDSLKDKVALVTGAGSGIGASTALLYAKAGCKVIVADIHEQAAATVASQIMEQGGEAVPIMADVSIATECKRMVKEALRQWGSLDIAFNNAGISGESNPIAAMSTTGWEKVIAVNLNSVFYCMKYQLQQMEKQGYGTIVNMSSILGKVGFANAGAYVAAKHGVVGLTQTAAIEYAAKGIRINAVGPAFIDTPLLDGLSADIKTALVGMHPIGRFGKPEEVADFVIWLSSEKASFANGGYYPIDGGYLSM